jgi:hypothetical protein
MEEQHVVQTLYVTATNPSTYRYIVNGDMENPYLLRNAQMFALLCEYAPNHLHPAIAECLDTSTPFVLDVTNVTVYTLKLVGTESPEKVYLRLWGNSPIQDALQQRREAVKEVEFSGVEGRIRAAVGDHINIRGSLFSVTGSHK